MKQFINEEFLSKIFYKRIWSLRIGQSQNDSNSSNHLLYNTFFLNYVQIEQDHPLSLEKFRRKPATRRFDESFAPIVIFDERFARQQRFELPPSFHSASFYTTIVHRLSGLNISVNPYSLKEQVLEFSRLNSSIS